MGESDIRKSRRDETVILDRGGLDTKQGWTLVVASGTPNEKRFPLKEKSLIIGYAPECDVVVDDPSVSRKHCEIRPLKVGAQLKDLGSRNGTFVGNHRIEDAYLYDGINVTIGSTQFFLTSDTENYGDLKNAPTQFGEAIANSSSMRRVFSILERVAPTDVTVMILGETGTGKDVLARAIHRSSQRKNEVFEIFDAGAVAPTLIESKLFGHKKGSFTGAIADQKGAFVAADRGTLFIDEIGELNLDLQPTLLRALEEGTVAPLGGAERVSFDARVIAATNRELETEVKEGRFREDLYYRLGVVFVRVPPLRERREDIVLLAKHFTKGTTPKVVFSDSSMELLQRHEWPGNVRELKNVVLGAVAVCTSNTLEPKDFFSLFDTKKRANTLDGLPLGGRTLESIEKAAIQQTLERLQGNKTKTAKALGIATSTLYEKLKKYELG